MLVRRLWISACCLSSMSKTLTWILWRVSGNHVSTSSEMKKSSRSGFRSSRARQPSIESWSVIVTKSMPRSLAMR